MIAAGFWAVTILCCGYAALFGGRDGRLVAALYLGGSAATAVAWLTQSDWHHTHIATFIVDAVVLIAFCAVAMKSNRWFPVWIAGLHLVTILSHTASLLTPGYAFKLYFFLQSFWSIPILLVLAIGVELDRRGGIFDERHVA